ncbi:MAG: DUF222 domain-containing protein, partial [Propioniciclava sp.]
ETLLISRAANQNARNIPDLVDGVLRAVAPDRAPSVEDRLNSLDGQHRRAHNRRSLRFIPDGDGAVTIKGSLPTTAAAPFEQFINTLVETDRRAGPDHAHDHHDPRAVSQTPDQRRADALIRLVGYALSTKPASATLGGDRPRIVVHIRETDLRNQAEQAGILTTGQPITAGELRRIRCDAGITPITHDSDSTILDVGREKRLVTNEIRQTLSDRDGRCQFPGCETPPSRCEAHHVIPWWNRGPTSLHNLVLLCPHHHGPIEPPRFRTGPPPDRWHLHMTPTGKPEFTPPQRLDPHQTPIPAQPPTG